MDFLGFSAETIQFFSDLEQNNNKPWFEKNRSVYENHVLPEAQSFVQGMGQKLHAEISENIEAIPKIDKSIFRLHRDVRFSKNKDPYKTHLGIFFWEGQAKKIENPGFYFQLNAREIFYGVGLHIFPSIALTQWRQALTDDSMGLELEKINAEILNKNNNYQVMGSHYKKVPRDFSNDHPMAAWLLYNGLAYFYRQKLDKTIHQSSFLDFSFEVFKNMSPIHFWLLKMLKHRI